MTFYRLWPGGVGEDRITGVCTGEEFPHQHFSSFKHLEDYLCGLRWLLILLFGLISVLPTSIYFIHEFGHTQERAEIAARHLAFLTSSYLEKHAFAPPYLSPYLREEMANNQVLSLRLLGQNRNDVLWLGEPRSQILVRTTESPVPLGKFAVQSVIIQRDLRPLVIKTAKVFGAHLLLASLLAVVIYIIPSQALRRAMHAVQTAHSQIVQTDKIHAIGEAYAKLAHELQNPLSILLTRTHLLLDVCRHQQSHAELTRDVEVIARHATRIADILQGLLPFARQTPLEFVPTDLHRVITETIAMLEQPFAREGIRIESFLVSPSPVCLGSHNHLQQVFLNLLNNARDAMPQGGQIVVRTSQLNSHMVTEVQDTGTGIAPHICDRIFEPFFTTKKAGQGTGLGLAVSYGIVTAHKGTIAVESTLGKGTIFRLTLPAKEEGHASQILQGPHHR